MNRNIGRRAARLLIVSQFTLYGDCRKGRRPSFDRPPRRKTREASMITLWSRAKTGVPVETESFRLHAGSPGQRRSGYYLSGIRIAGKHDTTVMLAPGFSGIRATDISARRSPLRCPISARACCCIRARGWKSGRPRRICRCSKTWRTCYQNTRWRGYYGGIRIIQALIVRFMDYCRGAGNRTGGS